MTINEAQKKNERVSSEETNTYCDECIYHWCVLRAKVNMCTMKTKGLFECRSCYVKLHGNRDEKLPTQTVEYKPLVTI